MKLAEICCVFSILTLGVSASGLSNGNIDATQQAQIEELRRDFNRAYQKVDIDVSSAGVTAKGRYKVLFEEFTVIDLELSFPPNLAQPFVKLSIPLDYCPTRSIVEFLNIC